METVVVLCDIEGFAKQGDMLEILSDAGDDGWMVRNVRGRAIFYVRESEIVTASL